MLVDYARMCCFIPFFQIDPILFELNKGWVVILEMICCMIRCQVLVVKMAFDGGIECLVIDVDIFKHSRFVQPSSTFVSFLTTFLGAGATYRRISSFCSFDCYTCRLRNWFRWRSFGCLLSVPFESQINIGTDLFTVQGVKVMLVFYNKNKRQIWLKV